MQRLFRRFLFGFVAIIVLMWTFGSTRLKPSIPVNEPVHAKSKFIPRNYLAPQLSFEKPMIHAPVKEILSESACSPFKNLNFVNYSDHPSAESQVYRYPADLRIFDSDVVRCNKNSELVIGVKSSFGNFELRKLLRKGWMSGGFCDTDKSDASRLCRWAVKHTAYAFFVSTPAYTTPEKAQDLVENKDVIQLSAVEHYRNNTIKTTTALYWAVSRCKSAKYVLIIDDDVYLNITNVWRTIFTYEYRKNSSKQVEYTNLLSVEESYKWSQEDRRNRYHDSLLSGFVVPEPEVMRSGKHRVPDVVYQPDYYPDYIIGWFTLMSVKVAENIARCSMCTLQFWVDDVFLFGLVANYLAIDRLSAPALNRTRSLNPRTTQHFMAVLLD